MCIVDVLYCTGGEPRLSTCRTKHNTVFEYDLMNFVLVRVAVRHNG